MDAGLSICRKSLVGWKSYLLNECMYLPTTYLQNGNTLFCKLLQSRLTVQPHGQRPPRHKMRQILKLA